MKFVYLLAILTISTGANAFTPKLSDFKSVELYDGEMINVKAEVEAIQFADDRINLVDYIELKEGSVIDSYDIRRIHFSRDNHNFSTGNRLILAREAGDGSGG